ncbi:hypothetical protein ABZ770_26090 [Streptomyces sp. NPDC006654]|uniref:hypothetical protein n=1 Tax=unclassified Streptomyces TaxID=2593676 RepID=UPI0033D98B5D
MRGARHSPLTISEQGAFRVGVGREPTEAGTAAEAAMYVQYQIPAARSTERPWAMLGRRPVGGGGLLDAGQDRVGQG